MERKHIGDASALAALVRHLQDSTEADKLALARSLHDELGGLLVATKIDVVWLRRRLDHGDMEAAPRWARIVACLEQGLHFKSRIIEALRPTLLDNLGLSAALGWLAQEVLAGKALTLEEKYPEDPAPLDDRANIALFRIAQRALLELADRVGDGPVNGAETTGQARASIALTDRSHDVVLDIRGEGLAAAGEGAQARLALETEAMRQRLAPLGGEVTLTSTASGMNLLARLPWASSGEGVGRVL